LFYLKYSPRLCGKAASVIALPYRQVIRYLSIRSPLVSWVFYWEM
jgi:hypothetical protein